MDEKEKVVKPKKKTPKEIFTKAINEVNACFHDVPDALSIGIVQNVHPQGGARRYYAFDDSSQEAIDKRSQMAKAIKEAYDQGAFNLQQFADALRVEVESIQGLIDDEFREKHGLV